ncbi:hypothetical protein [Fischerella muscicola]|uniref:hypothetical protein n=1 Tax=Fischerella muscicola TaxID=92938 RepID=UPI000301F451|nr:hypothetical protein [Fischerella muscicola]
MLEAQEVINFAFLTDLFELKRINQNLRRVCQTDSPYTKHFWLNLKPPSKINISVGLALDKSQILH